MPSDEEKDRIIAHLLSSTEGEVFIGDHLVWDGRRVHIEPIFIQPGKVRLACLMVQPLRSEQAGAPRDHEADFQEEWARSVAEARAAYAATEWSKYSWFKKRVGRVLLQVYLNRVLR